MARDRAARLRQAAARCRQNIASGSPSCVVTVSWKDYARISISEAEELAKNLERFANDIEALDRELADLNSRYEVVQRGTYVNRHELKCYLISQKQSDPWTSYDKYMQCIRGCMQTWVPVNMECWRDTDIRVMGLCIVNAAGRMSACRLNCKRLYLQ